MALYKKKICSCLDVAQKSLLSRKKLRRTHDIGLSTLTTPNCLFIAAMPYLTLRDNASLFYKDWGSKTGPAVVLSHGWPLTSDTWEAQMFFLASHGFRAVAHDRRGHGRSEQTWDGNDVNTWADDLDELITHLDLNDVTLVGHSTGGGEIARYVGRRKPHVSLSDTRSRRHVLTGT